MKKLLFIFCLALFSKTGISQTQPAPLIWGVSPFQDSLWAMDTITWLPSINLEPLVTGSVVTGLNGLAFDPTTYKTYAILKIDPNTRHLAEISLTTGSCTIKGDLGDKFSSITFDKFGQLWGATGDGATNSETLYKINKATGATTLVFAMGNGLDGEVICYNRFDNKMYHWSGNGTMVFESWPLASTTYTPANIAVSGTTGNETFGALCLKANDFIISNISGNFKHLSGAGAYGNVLSTNPDDLRGLAMPPRFSVSNTTVCVRSGSVNIYSNCLQLYDSVYYYWGDGNVTQLLGTSAVTAAVTHTFASSGNYTLTVQLYNGAVAKSTIVTFPIVVNAAPLVSISGSTVVCPGNTITLSASGGGTSQWYAGGVAISGAIQNTLGVSTPGWYNMKKTNQNGCADTAAIGVLVVAASAPSISVPNGTICYGKSFTITPTGAASFAISGGTAVVSPTITSTYSVTGTSSLGCASSNTIICTVTVNPLPTLSITTSNSTICAGETSTLTVAGASLYSWNTTAVTNSIVVTLTVSTNYTVTGTSAEGCVNTNTISQDVSACTGITENKQALQNIRMLPNPTSGKVTLVDLTENLTVEVFDAIGQIVIKTQSQSERLTIDLSNYNSGIYFVRVSDHNKLIKQVKVIKE